MARLLPDISTASALARFAIPRVYGIRGKNPVIVPQGAQVIKDIPRKTLSAPPPIDEQFVELDPQSSLVRAHQRDEIGDTRIELAERVRLDSRRQSIEPFLGVRQEEYDRQCFTLPREVDRSLRLGGPIPLNSVQRVGDSINQPGVLTVDRG